MEKLKKRERQREGHRENEKIKPAQEGQCVKAGVGRLTCGGGIWSGENGRLENGGCESESKNVWAVGWVFNFCFYS